MRTVLVGLLCLAVFAGAFAWSFVEWSWDYQGPTEVRAP